MVKSEESLIRFNLAISIYQTLVICKSRNIKRIKVSKILFRWDASPLKAADTLRIYPNTKYNKAHSGITNKSCDEKGEIYSEIEDV